MRERKNESALTAVINEHLLALAVAIFGCTVCAAQQSCMGSDAFKNSTISNCVDVLLSKYTNNELVIASAGDCLTKPSYMELCSANVPMQLAVMGSASECEKVASAVASVRDCMPTNIAEFLARNRRMAHVAQWVVHRSIKEVECESDFVSNKAYPAALAVEDIDFAVVSNIAASLTWATLPISVRLSQVYGEYIYDPMKPAEPLKDYPDPHPEVTFSTPYAIGIVLRAPEKFRAFRFFASPELYRQGEYEICWKQLNGTKNAVLFRPYRRKNCPGKLWKKMTVSAGYAELVVNWEKVGSRVDVGVFCRMKGAEQYGPASIISFHVLPEERRSYYKDGGIDTIDYSASTDWGNVVGFDPRLSYIKNWKDVYNLTGDGKIIGFDRYEGAAAVGKFSQNGEAVIEQYPSEMPKIVKGVEYAVNQGDSGASVLEYKIVGAAKDVPPGSPRHPARNDFRLLGELK